MFKFKGISSEKMKVICEEEKNLLAKASLTTSDSQFIDSSLNYSILGYNVVEGSLKIFFREINLDEIKKWLSGVGALEYNDRLTKIAFLDGYNIVRMPAGYCSADVNFVRSPFWYKAQDEYMIVESEIINEGNVSSEPIIRLEKENTDSLDISINDVRFVYTFPDDENYVEIDCENCNAMYETFYRNMNLEITYDFPKLHPGINVITVNSGNCIVKIKRKDVWL